MTQTNCSSTTPVGSLRTSHECTSQRRQPAQCRQVHPKTWNKLGNQAATLKDVLKAVEANIGDKVCVVGGVAIFCDPATYPSQDEVNQLATQGVGVAFGLHPKTKNVSEDSWNKFTACLQLEGVRALGEVGLDHFKIAKTLWDQQHIVLSRALDHLTPDKVLVLHNRGDGTELLELLFHLKGVVPKEQRIHLHCYSGNASTRDRWVATFPNVHFGDWWRTSTLHKKKRCELWNQVDCC